MKLENRWRFNLMGTVFLMVTIVIFGQLVRLQNTPQAQSFLEQSSLYAGTWEVVNAPRGQVYDRWGKLLAGNRTVYEVGVVLANVEDAQAIAFAVNAVLEDDYERVLELVSIPASEEAIYAMIADNVPAEKVDLLNDYMEERQAAIAAGETPDGPSLAGLEFRPHLARSYPEDALASTLLGFVGQDKDGIQGYFGIEQYYDELLAGNSREVWLPNDPNRVEELPDIPPGTSLILTIDRELQASVETILDEALEEHGAEAGTVVVMDPKTGEILALASAPRLNLNEFWDFEEIFPGETPFNRAVSKSYEPGSVFKVITMASAIDAGVVEPQTEFFDTGSIQVGGITIRNWDQRAWGEQNMVGCMQNSLNVCLAWVSKEMQADLFYDYLQRFGFGHTTGVDLAGEATGRLKEPGDGDWYPADLGTNSFGQGIAVTPMQMVMAISALANEGQMVVPHVVRALVDGDSQYEVHPQFSASPITPETARIMTEMLAETLENEASRALVPGYRVAGKTGTAEIPTEGGYKRDITNTSFVGWGPVDDPQFIVYVWLESPSSSIWGSVVAAPVFSQVVTRLVVILNLPPDSVRLALSPEEAEQR
ncbi:MAG: penicillin-binding protein 2 [Anaerolineae bacterium]|nr:penicillin-binding protein 2 [Anaerolineae bacterium]